MSTHGRVKQVATAGPTQSPQPNILHHTQVRPAANAPVHIEVQAGEFVPPTGVGSWGQTAAHEHAQ